MDSSVWGNSWVWLIVALIGFGLCAILPIWIKDDNQRRLVNWIILIPVSLVLIFYVYPFGLEVFRQFSLTF